MDSPQPSPIASLDSHRHLVSPAVPVFRKMGLLLTGIVALCTASPQAHAWGPMHATITEGAFETLPQWQRDLLANQRQKLIEFDCILPDLVRAPAYRKTMGRFGVLPNGDSFTHEPHSREHNVFQMQHYFEKAVECIRNNDLDEASRYAGCLLHFLEDCGSPAHSMPGDNQHGLMKDLLDVPEEFRDQPLHGLIESGSLKIDLAGYRPQLLGTTVPEAVLHLVERLNVAIRNARAQVISILQGVFKNAQEEIDKGRLQAATVDAQVAADALYTIISIAKQQFDPQEAANLKEVDVASLTPLEVMSQSYFPQHSYFSKPYFGYPVRNGILEEGKRKQPLVLNAINNGEAREQTFEKGFGLGTNSRLTFALPEKVYDRFECTIGLHPTLGAEGGVVFRFFVDGQAVFHSGLIMGKAPAPTVSLPIWRAREITIQVEGHPSVTSGKNYAVIGKPILRKAEAPPKLDIDKTR